MFSEVLRCAPNVAIEIQVVGRYVDTMAPAPRQIKKDRSVSLAQA
jgi:hypothetical protein